MAIKLYWPSVMIQDPGDKRAWRCGSYTGELSLEAALDVIEEQRKNHVVLCAWVHEQIRNVGKRPCYFECFTDSLGRVNGQFIRPKEDRP